MNPCKLITYFCQYSVIRLDTENGDAVCFQAITGIQEFAVRTDMNITTAFCTDCIGNYGLDFFYG